VLAFLLAQMPARCVGSGRVEMWRGGRRFRFVCLPLFRLAVPSNFAIAPFPHPARRTEHAIFPHSALGQDLMLSATEGCVCVVTNEPALVPPGGTGQGSASSHCPQLLLLAQPPAQPLADVGVEQLIRRT